jgi:glycosyltransferase involved in cell wall biosynthesis
MIHLLAIQPVAERGGSDQALLRMLRSLPPDEFTCHVAVPAEPPLRTEFEAAGVVVHVVPMARISRSHGVREWIAYAAGWPLAVARLARLVRSCEIDVVQSNSLHSWYGWAVAAITGRAHVWHAREIVVQAGSALTVERLLARHFATTVICMSDAIGAQLHPDNLVVIRETADPDEYKPARAGRFRNSAGIPDDVPLAGAAGRVDTWKGYDVLLDAFEIAKQADRRLHLVVAGGAVAGKEWLFDALEARAATMPDVRWLGPRTDLADVLADLDSFVLPSTEPEPYGLVAVEALACGVPVIATDAGGPREIAHDAVPGSVTLVAPRDAAALARAIGERFAGFSDFGTAARQRRIPLRTAEPERFAGVFRAAAARGGNRHRGR